MTNLLDKKVSETMSQHWKTLLICIGLSCLLATLPHLASLFYYGTSQYIANFDDHVYLSISRAPYWGEWTLRDPFSSLADHVPTLHSWAIFVPPAKLARLLDLDFERLPLVIRTVGAVLLAYSLHFLFFQIFRDLPNHSFWVTAGVVICLCDCGFVSGRSLIENSQLIANSLRGILPPGGQLLGQYRIVTPLLDLPALIAFAGCLIGAQRKPRKYVPLAILFGGISVYQYFFFWTAALFGLFIIAVISITKTGKIPAVDRSLIVPILIAVGILAVGAPQLIRTVEMSNRSEYKPILERLERGQHLEKKDPSRLQYISNKWLWAKLLFGALAIYLSRQKSLTVLFALTLSGYFLANSAAITHIEFENYHWAYVFSGFGELLVISALIVLSHKYLLDKSFRRITVLTIIILVPSAIYLRFIEPLCAQPAAFTRAMAETQIPGRTLLSLGDSCVIAGSGIAAEALLLHTRCGRLYSAVQTAGTSLIPTFEVDERYAFNAWLSGASLHDIEVANLHAYYSLGSPFSHPEFSSAAISSRRVDAYLKIPSNLSSLFQKYKPTHLLTPNTGKLNARIDGKVLWSDKGQILYELVGK